MRFSQIRVAKLKNPQTILSIVLQITIILLAVVYPLLSNPQKASAGTTEAFVMFDRISGTSKIAGWACMKSTLTTQTNVVLVFPAGWTLAVAGSWTTSTSNLPSDPGGGTPTAWPSISANATNVTGLSVTFTGAAFSSSTALYCFHFDGSAGSTMTVGDNQIGQLKTQGGSPYTDSINWAVSIVAANGEQVTVNASVSATMQFSLGSNTISLGTLSTSTTTSGNAVATITTNARNGWVTWLQAANGSASAGWLHSTTANANIATGGLYPTTYDLASVTGYVVAAIASTGTTDPAYATTGAGGTNGGLTSTQLRQLAYNTNAETAANTVTVYARAKITSTQPAATDYTDTLTIVAAGSF
jgi:hypothetical protein